MSNFDLVKLVDQNKLPQLNKMGEFTEFVNAKPPTEWLDRTPDGRANTMPIGRVEALLTYLFQEWWVEVLNVDSIFNSLVCTVRVHYKHPIDGEWKQQDGVGAAPAKTVSGASAADMTKILNDAVQTGLPAAKSFAIKDACDHIGRIFGRDINRKGNYSYTNQYSGSSDEPNFTDEIEKAKSVDELTAIFNRMNPEQKKLFTEMLSEKKKELTNAVAN